VNTPKDVFFKQRLEGVWLGRNRWTMDGIEEGKEKMILTWAEIPRIEY
jgi:hypothetical protein